MVPWLTILAVLAAALAVLAALGLWRARARDAAARTALARAERLASLAQLAAAVAHEVSSPAGCILANLTQLREAAAPGEGPAARALDDSLDAVRRIRAVVSALR